MPELPDITVYCEAIARRTIGKPIQRIRILNPFFLRTFDPSITDVEQRLITGVRRVGKRVCLGTANDLWLVIHLMIAGRLHWKPLDAKLGGKLFLASCVFDDGQLVITEAGSKRRASLHVVRGETGLAGLDPGGVDPFLITVEQFAIALRNENHSVKNTLTDPSIFSGIGNAYSDEILHHARLSPLLLSQKMTDEQIARLYKSTQSVLLEWTERLRAEVGDGFPEKVTAFRTEMAVHGKWKQPCPVCATPVQRIRYADNETNYCPRCQTGGKLLADRAMSRLLKQDRPKHIDEL
jgi:formamidopyrimidine-DNA glycosylase